MTSSDDIALIQIADMLQELVASGQVVEANEYERFVVIRETDNRVGKPDIVGVTFTLYIYPPETGDTQHPRFRHNPPEGEQCDNCYIGG